MIKNKFNSLTAENVMKPGPIHLDKGVPVNAFGLQGHWNINDPKERNHRDAIDKFSSLGLKIQITELDV